VICRSTDRDRRGMGRLVVLFGLVCAWLLTSGVTLWLLSCSEGSGAGREADRKGRPEDARDCRLSLLQAVDFKDAEAINRHADSLLLLDPDLAFATANELAAAVFKGESTYANYALFQLAPDLAERLVQQSRSEDFERRKLATIALGRVRGSKKDVVDALIERLEDEEVIATASVESLGYLRSDAQSAIPRLADLVRHGSGPIRISAAHSIVRISIREARKIAKELEDQDPELAQEMEEMIVHQQLEDIS